MTKQVRHVLLVLVVCVGVLLSAPTLLAQPDPLDAVNCALTPDQIMGQAYSHTAGAAGEIDQNGMTPDGEDILGASLDASVDWIMETLPYSAMGREQVAILIIDDFSSEGDRTTPPSHGWLVFQLLEQLHELLPRDIVENIHLQPVNIAGEYGYRSDLIVPEVQSTLAELSAQGITRFVLNMSFVFIPCRDQAVGFDIREFVAARQDNPARSLVEELGGDAQYVRSVLRDPRVLYIDQAALTTIDQEASRDNPSLRGASGATPAIQVRPTPSAAVPQFREQDLRVVQLLSNARMQNDPLRDLIRQARGMTIVPVAS
ncbi:MAG: hypothetical protein KJ065_27040, partial [Anaerolineae bacterium]|nr:hypothetical protein [Anaerolineae bacterium]